jgi:hypothetical protein
MRVLLCLLLIALAAPVEAQEKKLGADRPAKEIDWPTRLERFASESTHVFLGKIPSPRKAGLAPPGPVAHPSGPTKTTFQVERSFKGAGSSSLTVILSERDSPGISAVYFLAPAGRHLKVICVWTAGSWHTAREAVFRADKRCRVPGIPIPEAKGGLVLGLGIVDAHGKARTQASVGSYAELQALDLLLQFENLGSSSAVMPPLDGSTSKFRFPHYVVEVRDAKGQPAKLPRQFGCKTTNPLRARDVIPLASNEVFRTSAPWFGNRELDPGTYTVRLRYVAKRDPQGQKIQHTKGAAQVRAALKTVWEGTLVSNWITIKVTAPAKRPRPAKPAKR